jgi:hypothetical protein
MKWRWLPVPTSVLVAGSKWIVAGVIDEISLPFAEYVSRKSVPRANCRTVVPSASRCVVTMNVPLLW